LNELKGNAQAVQDYSGGDHDNPGNLGIPGPLLEKGGPKEKRRVAFR